MPGAAGFEIDDKPVQHILPLAGNDGYEGVAISNSGILAVASAYSNDVLLFRPKDSGGFEETPYLRVGQNVPKLVYPHDVAFSTVPGDNLLAVAERPGIASIYETDGGADNYRREPSFIIRGEQSQLHYTDGIAFVPPDDAYLATCNGLKGTITFYRRISRSPLRYEKTPEFVLRHKSMVLPDGLGFSPCGEWLATANHTSQNCTVFRRRRGLLSGGKLRYGPRPAAIIDDPQLRHPHSVAFTPGAGHLILTNAGANFFSAHLSRQSFWRKRWTKAPVAKVATNNADAFHAVNSANAMEGGPKGVAVDRSRIVVGNPEFGIKVFSYRETPG